MEDLKPRGKGPEKDHENTPEAQRARSVIIRKCDKIGLGGSQITLEGKDRSFNYSAIEVQF